MLPPIYGISPETVRKYNTRLMELYSLYLNLCPRVIEKQAVTDLAADCALSLTEAMAHLLAAYFELDATGRDRDFFRGWLLPSLEEQSIASYVNDAYFKNIRRSFSLIVR